MNLIPRNFFLDDFFDDFGKVRVNDFKCDIYEEDKNYIRKERVYGSTKRQFYVGDVDEDSIKANFSDGVLKVVVPKKEEISSKKKIEIQ